jgi:hypothetical protein
VSDVHGDYVEGDINAIDDDDLDNEVDDDLDNDLDNEVGNDLDNEVGNDLDNDDDRDREGGALAPTASAALAFIATSLADEPAAVAIDASERAGKVVLSLRVGASDMGRVIGRRGRTAQAIRSLVAAAGARDGVNATVDIVD